MIRIDSCKEQTALAASHNCIETGWPKETKILKRKPQLLAEAEVNMSKTHGRDAITNMKIFAKEISCLITTT